MTEQTGAEGEKVLSRILIVDDDPDIRGAVSFLLKKEGYAPEPCGSGREALAMLQSGKHFDLVIMDMVMPGLSGAETRAANAGIFLFAGAVSYRQIRGQR